MTREEKQTLLIDLCARLPYGVKCQTKNGIGTLISIECSFGEELAYIDFGRSEAEEYALNDDDIVKPYLRSMSSMTEEEYQEFGYDVLRYTTREFDWLNAHQFDYRIDPSTGKTLIESGLALEAPKDMYKTE